MSDWEDEQAKKEAGIFQKLYQKNRAMKALLKEAECPHKCDNGYKTIRKGFFTIRTIEFCDWCAKREELING